MRLLFWSPPAAVLLIGTALLTLPAEAGFNGGFGSAQWRFAKIGGSDSWLMGGKGGGFITDNLYIGGAGYGLVEGPHYYAPDSEQPSAAYDGYQLELGYGGLLIGSQYQLSHRAVSSVELLLGAGGVCWSDGDEYDYWHDPDEAEDGEAFPVIELSVGGHWHLVPWLSLGAGGSLRKIHYFDQHRADDLPPLPELSDLDWYVELRFGG